MLEAIRTRSVDPYATLQLDALAAPALVDAMHAMLAQRPGVTPETRARLDAARDVLSDPAARAAYDRDHGYNTRRSLPNHYQSLDLAVDADAAAIDLAYAISVKSGASRALASNAYRTLSNAYLRARYDASLTALERIAVPSLAAYVPPADIASDAGSTDAFERRMASAPPSASERLPDAGVDGTPATTPDTAVADATAGDHPPSSAAAQHERPTPLVTEATPPATEHPAAGAGPEPVIVPARPDPIDAAPPERPSATAHGRGSRPDPMTARLLELAADNRELSKHESPASAYTSFSTSGAMPIRWAHGAADE